MKTRYPNRAAREEKSENTKKEKKTSSTYEDIVLYPNDVAASQVGRRQWRNVELLISPVVRFAGFDFAPVERSQLSCFRLDDSVFSHVLDRLHKTREQHRPMYIRVTSILFYE